MPYLHCEPGSWGVVCHSTSNFSLSKMEKLTSVYTTCSLVLRTCCDFVEAEGTYN